MNEIKVIIILVLLIVAYGCKNIKDTGTYIEIKQEYRDVVFEYINNNENYNTFLLIPMQRVFSAKFIDAKYGNGYLIGPCFPLLKEFYKGSGFVKVGDVSGKRVYMLSQFSELFENNDTTWENTCKLDKFVLLREHHKEEIYPKGPSSNIINYLCRANLVSKSNGKIIVNTRPDTLVLPVIKEDYPVEAD